MVRLLFRGGPFDGGTADFTIDHRARVRAGKRRKGKRSPPVDPFPKEAYIASADGAWWVWVYRRIHTTDRSSAVYACKGWVKAADIDGTDGAIVVIGQE